MLLPKTRFGSWAAEQQLAQQKAQLDTRENALDEKVNALDERVNALDQRLNALAEKQKAMTDAQTNSTSLQGEPPDPAQLQAERDRARQQLATDMRAQIPDPSQVKAAKVEKDREIEKRVAQRQRGLGQLQSQTQRKLEKAGISPAAVFAAPEATSPTPSPALEAASPTSSPTP